MMRMSRLFSRTRRKTEGDDGSSAELLVRAGFVRQLAAGIYSLLPPGFNVARRIEAIIREEMDAIDGQELLMPVVHPAEIWQESGRWQSIGEELGRFTDRNRREMVLAMTHEEVVADLVRNEVHSYRQLPCLVYHIQTKWRDDPRPRAGLIRVREFTMLDSYSLDSDVEGLKQQYQRHFEAYPRIFERCGIPVSVVESDTGDMGGLMAHEYMYRTPIGEDTIIHCTQCAYTANQQIATAATEASNAAGRNASPELELEKRHTPNCKTIDDLAAFLGIEPHRCAKALFLTADFAGSPRTVIVMVPGDREVNETKVAKLLNSAGATPRSMRPADDGAIRSCGAVPGYGSPIGTDGAFVIVDSAIESIGDMVTGANEESYHYLHMRFPRDFQADVVADVTSAVEGDRCSRCDGTLESYEAVEVGNIFQLGTRYSDPLGCTFLDRDGERRPVQMGSYGIGVGRLLACIAEEHHDDSGLVWPQAVAPWDVHIVDLTGGSEHTESLCSRLESAGRTVLLDDRDERAGVKFNDADLMGVPVRITLGKRSIEKGVYEVAFRATGERKEIAMDHIIEAMADTSAART